MRILRVSHLPGRGALLAAIAACALCLPACKQRQQGGVQQRKPGPAAFAPDANVVLLGGDSGSLDGAREGLAAALRLQQDLPLPYPRVERHGDRFRVVLGRGKYAALQGLAEAVPGARLVAAGETGGDDVVRLAIVCTQGEEVPLYKGELPAEGKPAEIGKLAHGEVLVLKDEEEAGEGGGEEVEQGFLRVLVPRAGLVQGADVLLPPDCIPRDEDNDDGNGRLLQGGRLCLTTRFSGRDGEVNRAALLAVAPSYRRCVKFAGAGTFDGFDLNPAGTQFAVEDRGPDGKRKEETLDIYDVGPRGELSPRAQLPGLQRPAYLAGGLVATFEQEGEQGLVMIDGNGGQQRRIFALSGPRFVPAAPTYRPAAPTLRTGTGEKQGPDEVVASFQQACQKADEKRVRAVARSEFEQCVMEVEVEVGLDGKNPRRHCEVNNAPGALEEPISVPCK